MTEDSEHLYSARQGGGDGVNCCLECEKEAA